MSEMKQRAEHVRKKKAAFGPDVNLAEFSRQGGAWEYDPDYRRFSAEERSRLLSTGIELTDEDHAGTFLQADKTIVHCRAQQPGVEVLPITEAVRRYDWVADHLWRLVAVDADKYTAIPELEGRVAGVNMSHEAAVGKIAAEEVEMERVIQETGKGL